MRGRAADRRSEVLKEQLIADIQPPREYCGDEGLWNVVGMRHPYVRDAIGESFWHEPQKARRAVVVPVRPDNQPGRIGQQSSCFTLHMHNSERGTNETLAKMLIPAAAKSDLLTKRAAPTQHQSVRDLQRPRPPIETRRRHALRGPVTHASVSSSCAPIIRSRIGTPTGHTPRQGAGHSAHTDAFFSSAE